METSPSKIIERLGALLIPPAYREHVLGDLAERYTSTRHYLRNLLSILPYLILSRIRRNWNPGLTLIEAFATFVSYVGALSLLQAERVHAIEWVGLSMALMIAALALADAYAPQRESLPALRVLFASSICVLVLVLLNPAYAAVWALGGLICTLMISLHRAWLPPRNIAAVASGPPLEEDALIRRIRNFEARIRRRNLREYVAAAAVIVFFAAFLQRDVSLPLRVSFVMIISGAMFNMVHLRRRGAAGKLPEAASRSLLVDFYRAELTRQRDLLRGVWTWALAPMLPGLLTFLIGSVAPHPDHWVRIMPFTAISAIVFVMIWSANRHAAKELQQEIDALE